MSSTAGESCCESYLYKTFCIIK